MCGSGTVNAMKCPNNLYAPGHLFIRHMHLETYTVKPQFTNTSDQEQFWFTNKFSEHEASWMTYCDSSYEHARRQNVDENKSHWTTF